MRRLDIGVASYGASMKLQRTLASIRSRSTTDWRCYIIDNPGPDPKTRDVIRDFCSDSRFKAILLDENAGYAGAVNRLFELAKTEYIAYCDNDVQIRTTGWDEKMCGLLDRYHELGIVFPNPLWAIAPLQRNGYTETLWGTGFCWVTSRVAVSDAGPLDESLGHQEEADFCLRLRMEGYRCAMCPQVAVDHEATATQSAESQERIARGVIKFVNKWTRYFCGKGVDYHSPNVMRWEDWPPNALYLEEFFKTKLPADFNQKPAEVEIGGWEYDLIQVPRRKDFYRGRII